MEPFDLYRARGSGRGWVQEHGSVLVELFRFADTLFVVLGLAIAMWRVDLAWQWSYALAAMTTALVFGQIARRWTVYRSWRAMPLRDEVMRVTASWAVTVLVLAGLLSLMSPELPTQRELLPVWAGSTLLLLVGLRLLVRPTLHAMRKRGSNFRTAAIIGATPAGLHVRNTLEAENWIGIKVVGVFDDRVPLVDRVQVGLTVTGSMAELRERIEQGQLDIVYIALPLRAEVRIGQLVEELRDLNVSVQFVADFSALGLLNPSWDLLGGMPTVTVIDTPHRGIDGALKRGVDIVGSLVALALLGLPMLVVALAIKLDSPGPAVFRQRRYGLDGQEFEIYKFRTMNQAASSSQAWAQATRGDSRITRLGALLRRTSIDELPQFINVLQGRMSIVGPRPHPIALDEAQRKLIKGYRLRHKVRPGITGWAQVNGYRGETDTPDKMLNRIRFDLEYIDDWSIWLDIRIIFMTAFKVLNDSKAY